MSLQSSYFNLCCGTSTSTSFSKFERRVKLTRPVLVQSQAVHFVERKMGRQLGQTKKSAARCWHLPETDSWKGEPGETKGKDASKFRKFYSLLPPVTSCSEVAKQKRPLVASQNFVTASVLSPRDERFQMPSRTRHASRTR